LDFDAKLNFKQIISKLQEILN